MDGMKDGNGMDGNRYRDMDTGMEIMGNK